MKITILVNGDGRKGINQIWNNISIFEDLGLKIVDVFESD